MNGLRLGVTVTPARLTVPSTSKRGNRGVYEIARSRETLSRTGRARGERARRAISPGCAGWAARAREQGFIDKTRANGALAAPYKGRRPRISLGLRLRLCTKWWRGQDLNLRPSGYEPDELPDCSTPRRLQKG